MTRVQAVARPSAAAPSIWLEGAGQVGSAFLRRARHHGLHVAAVRNSKGFIHAPDAPATVLVDATAPCYTGARGAAWVHRLESALRQGTHVVTCNKAPLALDWPRLQQAAKEGNATLACSATVGAGTPVLATLRRLHAVHGLTHVEATLSGTLGFVLAQSAQGRPLDEAVRAAQEAGYAEPDPRCDLDGTDALAKAIIIHNAVFGGVARLPREPPLRIDEQTLQALRGRPGVPVTLARIGAAEPTLRLECRDDLPRAPPSSIVVRAVHGDGQTTDLVGPGAGVEATAASLVADVLAIGSGRTGPGVWP